MTIQGLVRCVGDGFRVIERPDGIEIIDLQHPRRDCVYASDVNESWLGFQIYLIQGDAKTELPRKLTEWEKELIISWTGRDREYVWVSFDRSGNCWTFSKYLRPDGIDAAYFFPDSAEYHKKLEEHPGRMVVWDDTMGEDIKVI